VFLLKKYSFGSMSIEGSLFLEFDLSKFNKLDLLGFKNLVGL